MKSCGVPSCACYPQYYRAVDTQGSKRKELEVEVVTGPRKSRATSLSDLQMSGQTRWVRNVETECACQRGDEDIREEGRAWVC